MRGTSRKVPPARHHYARFHAATRRQQYSMAAAQAGLTGTRPPVRWISRRKSADAAAEVGRAAARLGGLGAAAIYFARVRTCAKYTARVPPAKRRPCTVRHGAIRGERGPRLSAPPRAMGRTQAQAKQATHEVVPASATSATRNRTSSKQAAQGAEVGRTPDGDDVVPTVLGDDGFLIAGAIQMGAFPNASARVVARADRRALSGLYHQNYLCLQYSRSSTGTCTWFAFHASVIQHARASSRPLIDEEHPPLFRSVLVPVRVRV